MIDLTFGDILVSLGAGGVGGLLSAIAVAVRIGAWRGRIDTLLAEHERRLSTVDKRLARGDEDLAEIHALRAQMAALSDEIRALRAALSRLVTREECQARHAQETTRE